MLNPLQMLLLGQDPNDPRNLTQMGAPAPVQGQAPNAGTPPLSGDAGGAAAAPVAPGAGATNAGMLGAVAAPTASSVPQAPANPADQIDPNSGSRVGDLQQGLLATLGQMGPILMAAGQRMTPAQRAQIMTMGAAALGGSSRNVLNAAQARLVQQKATAEDVAAKRQNLGLQALMSDPNVPASVKQMALMDPTAATKLWTERQNPAATDFTQKRDWLKSIGKSDDEINQTLLEGDDHWTTVSHNGVLYRQNTKTGAVAPVDGQAPNPVAGMIGVGGQQPGQAPGAPGRPPGYIPGQISTPTNQGSQFAPPNPADAFGFGTWASLHTKDPFQRFWGLGRTPDAQARETAISQINTMHNDIAGVLAEGLPGQKSNDARKAIMSRLPPTAAMFTDPSSALNTYKGLYNEVEARAQQAQRTAAAAMNSGQQNMALQHAAEYQDIRRVQQNLGSVMDGLAANIQGRAYNPTADAARRQVGGQPGQIPDVLARARQIVGRTNGQ